MVVEGPGLRFDELIGWGPEKGMRCRIGSRTAVGTVRSSWGGVIAQLDSGVLAHYPDREFAGRCVLIIQEHAEHLDELPSDRFGRLMQDVRTAGRAIRRATGASRINYAVLGNVAPHLHIHLIPRGGPADRNFEDTPWGPPPALRAPSRGGGPTPGRGDR